MNFTPGCTPRVERGRGGSDPAPGGAPPDRPCGIGPHYHPIVGWHGREHRCYVDTMTWLKMMRVGMRAGALSVAALASTGVFTPAGAQPVIGESWGKHWQGFELV